MKIIDFLFGRKRGSDTPISHRVEASAQNYLDRKIMGNVLNRWYFVLLRKRLVYPVLKFPFAPLAEASRIRRAFRAFDHARSVFEDNGEKVKLRRSSGSLLSPEGLSYLLKYLFLRPAGHPLAVEYHVSRRLLILCYASWFVAMGCLAAAGWIAATGFARSFPSWSPSGREALFFRLACYSWSISFLASFFLSIRKWVKASEALREFLVTRKIVPQAEAETRLSVLSLPEFNFLSSPSLSFGIIKNAPPGWPNNFLPGAIKGSTRSPSDFIVKRRPEKKNIVFGGEHMRSDIKTHLKAYDKAFVSPMTEAMKEKNSSELLFLGEILDPRYWTASSVFVELKNCPHIQIVGQTRSGKTKSLLSLVYSIARAYPDTIWFFADGKDSVDYDDFAEYLSVYEVAKMDKEGSDPLIQFANVINAVWDIYMERQAAFTRARYAGKACSSIYEYRNLVGPMPQVFLVMDEFGAFNLELDFDQNWRTDGTIANRLKKLVAEAASFGIHLIFASQRYQNTDCPTVIRSNLTARLAHNVSLSDANLLECPEAQTLEKGQFYLWAQGLYCEHTGISNIRCKLPYIGDATQELLKATLTPIDPSLKKPWDRHLVYNRGSDDLEKMSIPTLALRLEKFFMDQDYCVKRLVQDVEATDLQIEIVKGNYERVTRADGTQVEELVPVEGAKALGVSLLRAEDVTEEDLGRIQHQYSNRKYPAILVFVVGKSAASSKLSSWLPSVNERGSRFSVWFTKDYYKGIKFIAMKKREGEKYDVIQDKLRALGVSHVSHSMASSAMDSIDMTVNTPMKLKIPHILRAVNLGANMIETSAMGVPIVSTIIPGGTRLNFLIVATKKEKDAVVSLATRIREGSWRVDPAKDRTRAQGIIVIMTGPLAGSATRLPLSPSSKRHYEDVTVSIWKQVEVDEMLKEIQGRDKTKRTSVLVKIMRDAGALRRVNEQDITVISPQAEIDLFATATPDVSAISYMHVQCAVTKIKLMSVKDHLIPIEQYSTEHLHFPHDMADIRVNIVSGFAPRGVPPGSVKLPVDYQPPKFPRYSKWEVVDGVLTFKAVKSGPDDDLLTAMKKG